MGVRRRRLPKLPLPKQGLPNLPMPTFGGFVVKADSEGNQGPQAFNKTEADGANLLARALKPIGGIVMWRAFVYNNMIDGQWQERAKQAYMTFKPLDGRFDDNVIVQVNN